MRALTVQVEQYGGPEVLTFKHIDLGDPDPGEVLLRQTAIGLNFADI
jgi:NADPH2:quinone reductase